jgi:5-methyltetrahydrofolate--homocysteine methyltransferase
LRATIRRLIQRVTSWKTKLFAILQREEIGLTWTDTFKIEPEQSKSAIVAHHLAAKYFVA